MPNLSALRQIVAALRGLVWKARDAGSPTSAAVIGMAAGAVQDVASAESRAERPAGAPRKAGSEERDRRRT